MVSQKRTVVLQLVLIKGIVVILQVAPLMIIVTLQVAPLQMKGETLKVAPLLRQVVAPLMIEAQAESLISKRLF